MPGGTGCFEIWITPAGKERTRVWSKLNGDGRVNAQNVASLMTTVDNLLKK